MSKDSAVDVSSDAKRLNELILKLKNHLGTGILSPDGKAALTELEAASAELVKKAGGEHSHKK